MKSGIIVKSLSVKNKSKVILCFFVLLLYVHSNLYPQDYKFVFRNSTLSEALLTVSSRLDVKVAFDSKRLGALLIDREVTGNTADEVMSSILKGTGLNYKLKYNRYLIVEDEHYISINPVTAYQITGSVSDGNTGEQLPYASVIVNEQYLQTSASENGSFSLQNIITNPLHLSVSYIGYNALDTSIMLTEKVTNLNLRLNNQFHVLDTILVEGSRIEMIELRSESDFAATINTTRLTDLPAIAETDIFRVLNVLPGVNYGENSRGLSIRGGSADQNLVLFDGQTIYNLSHYYGVVSALNPNVIKDLQVYKGGYDSRFGERVSGIVNIRSKSGNQYKPAIYGDINLLSANVTGEIPLGSRISVIGAVRRSYSDLYSTELAKGIYDRNMHWFRGDSSTIIHQTNPRFHFYDYNAKISYRRNSLESFSLSLYGSKDYFRNSYSGSSGDFMIDAAEKNIWSNYGLSASWLRQWNESFYSAVQTGISGYDNESSNLTSIVPAVPQVSHPEFLPNPVNEFSTFNRNWLKDYFISNNNNLQISAGNLVSFGFLVRRNSLFYHKDADSEYVYDNTYQSGWTASAYFQDRITAGRNLTIKPGVRFSFLSNGNEWFAEPRLSANYRISNSFSVRVAAGRYYQFLNQVSAQQETGYNKNFWIMAGNRGHPAVSSNHFIGGMKFEKDRFLLDAEAYYKTFNGLQEYIFVSPFLKNSDFHRYFPVEENPGPVTHPPPSSYITGEGRSCGIDILLSYKGQKYTSWLSCSLGRSIQNFSEINRGKDVPSAADQPYQLTWTNMYSTGRWNISSMTFYSAGRPYPDFTGGLPDQTTMRVYNRLPDYFRTDLSVNCSLSAGKGKLKPGISFINIFNTRNYFDMNSRKFDFESISFSEAILIRSQAFSVNAFIHFHF